jgi:hypothetical protein
MLETEWLVVVVVVEKVMKEERTVLYIIERTAFGSNLYTSGIPKFWLKCVELETIKFLNIH